MTFLLTGRNALFTDPVTKIGGEKTTYHVPTYEALKGVCRSIYWKPTFIWHIDKVRILNPIRTECKGVKPIKYHKSGNDLAYYTYLNDVAYEVSAHFEWNLNRPDLKADRNLAKHSAIMQRALERGGRQDIFLGTRECQGYVEPCEFGSHSGFYDDIDRVDFGLMFHSFAYPDELGRDELHSRFSRITMQHGVIEFIQPTGDLDKDRANGLPSRFVREMTDGHFSLGESLQSADDLYRQLEIGA
ncbi:type I-C CRISPR-associated protein Cas5c [Moraxella caviae]|nr:type I-C CRISPR-associated protein Cas5c [Moraxella caviae]